MNQAKLIYETNRQAINFMLIKKGYTPSFDGLLEAIQDHGDVFLVQLYNEVTSNFDEADGNFWTKFRNVFHKAVGIGSGVDTLINRDAENTEDKTAIAASEKELQEKNKKQLMYWGLGALGIIIILVLIYIFKK